MCTEKSDHAHTLREMVRWGKNDNVFASQPINLRVSQWRSAWVSQSVSQPATHSVLTAQFTTACYKTWAADSYSHFSLTRSGVAVTLLQQRPASLRWQAPSSHVNRRCACIFFYKAANQIGAVQTHWIGEHVWGCVYRCATETDVSVYESWQRRPGWQPL